jgi:hypothetical protein
MDNNSAWTARPGQNATHWKSPVHWYGRDAKASNGKSKWRWPADAPNGVTRATLRLPALKGNASRVYLLIVEPQGWLTSNGYSVEARVAK